MVCVWCVCAILILVVAEKLVFWDLLAEMKHDFSSAQGYRKISVAKPLPRGEEYELMKV